MTKRSEDMAELIKATIMQKRDRDLIELTKVFKEILKVSNEYSYLWDDEEVWKEDEKDKSPEKILYIAWGFIAQDETFHVYISKKGKKFVFDGKNFCDNDQGYGAREAALEIINHFNNYHITADELRKAFYSSLKKPLGRYLAKKTLEKII
ncbi:MAG: hypothetical protein PHH54_04840 [Candidatus Nanoarchaeia archaeon]|nr:hypothetical protein [Candidatus Nanoarchaeia archaeon]MDD5741284.1 hypothetical protein [Candidatus Nanoarchaeia archaeon]